MVQDFVRTLNVNNDVISTSGEVLFNTAQIGNYKWFFYNTNLSENGKDITKQVYYYDALNYDGVEETVANEYAALAANTTIFPTRNNTVYHYINGEWVVCTDGKDHGAHVS